MRAPSGSDTGASVSPTGECADLLISLESARDLLARSLVHEYHTVSDPELNYTTASVIFQILFLKTGQGCGFVKPGTLAALVKCDGIANRMGRACSDAGLIPEQFFEMGLQGTRTIPALPDEPLREIIRQLDQLDLPVPVVRLPLEDFAGVLDRFLGTRVQAGEGCRVNRAGKSALLYTGMVDVPPQEIVRSLVREAAGNISGNSGEHSKVVHRILDPACGAGLFLLAFYRFLARKKIRAGDRPEQARRILLDLAGTSVYGTDIDPESVSAARLVLLFIFIEESRRSGPGSVLPDTIRKACTCLAKNIRCGNALIAPDYFSGKPVFPFNAEERRRVNAFDWKEAFPDVMAEGGFDAVIGAPPPYRPFAVAAREAYFQTHYETYASGVGLYGYFIERVFSLLKPGGIIAVLVPGTFLRSRAARPLRRHLLTRQIVAVTSTGRTRPLPEGDVPVYALVLRNQPPDRPFVVSEGWDGRHDFTLDQRSLDDGGWSLEDTRSAGILAKIQARGTVLEEYVMGEIGAGAIHTRNNPLVVDLETKNRLTKRAWWCRRFFIPLLRPADVRRYVPERPATFVLSMQDRKNFRKCRALVAYLEDAVRDQEKKSGVNDNEDNPDTVLDLFMGAGEPELNRPQIVFAPYQHSPAFSLDPEGTCAIASPLHAIPRNDPFLAGILNSRLGRFVLIHTCPLTDRGYHISPAALGKFPVYVPDFDKLADKTRYDRMVSLVTHILELNKYLPQAKTDQARRLIRQDIDVTDVRIDALVYELYGLTVEEIAVVEAVMLEKSPV